VQSSIYIPSKVGKESPSIHVSADLAAVALVGLLGLMISVVVIRCFGIEAVGAVLAQLG
jgi:hypothetical protein